MHGFKHMHEVCRYVYVNALCICFYSIYKIIFVLHKYTYILAFGKLVFVAEIEQNIILNRDLFDTCEILYLIKVRYCVQQ